MGLAAWWLTGRRPEWNKPIEHYGEDAFLFHKSNRLCRFLIALGQANMMKRLSDENGQVWLSSNEVFGLSGVCRDRFDRAVQLNDLEAMGLIECHFERLHSGRGLWENQFVKISDLGLEAVNTLKTGVEGVIVIWSGSRTRCLPATMDILG
jgi:hypothetical protein